MKTKVSQKEWNDKRDQFLCAYMNGRLSNPNIADLHEDSAIERCNRLTSELYEVEENKETPIPQFIKEDWQRWNKLIRESNPQPKPNFPKGGIDEKSTIIQGEWVEPQDTRPLNPKVVEIFNEFLPKEIAPLAIEAHKISCKDNGYLNLIGESLQDCLLENINWVGKFKFKHRLGDYCKLFEHTQGNTITATPEQLREWFPQAYENKGGELVMLAKEYYMATDGSIKKGILKDSVWYAPANDLYKNEGGENE
jgi:hypothetical protein